MSGFGRKVRGTASERGYELVPTWDVSGRLWDELMGAIAPYDGKPCGLGARDTLRTEMGYPLHGHELSLDITPVQARAGWAVGWSKPQFWGREALSAEKAAGPRRTLRGLDGMDRGIPRAGMAVFAATPAPPGSRPSVAFAGRCRPARRVRTARLWSMACVPATCRSAAAPGRCRPR